MKRLLLKLSGEALAGAEKKGFDEATVIAVAKQIRTIVEEGTQVGIVIGGGNFWRGRTSETIDRNKADQIGMLATVMNCIYLLLQSLLNRFPRRLQILSFPGITDPVPGSLYILPDQRHRIRRSARRLQTAVQCRQTVS